MGEVTNASTKYITPREYDGINVNHMSFGYQTVLDHAIDGRDPQYHDCDYYVIKFLDNLVQHPYTIRGLRVYFTNQEDYNLVRLLYDS